MSDPEGFAEYDALGDMEARRTAQYEARLADAGVIIPPDPGTFDLEFEITTAAAQLTDEFGTDMVTGLSDTTFSRLVFERLQPSLEAALRAQFERQMLRRIAAHKILHEWGDADTKQHDGIKARLQLELAVGEFADPWFELVDTEFAGEPFDRTDHTAIAQRRAQQDHRLLMHTQHHDATVAEMRTHVGDLSVDSLPPSQKWAIDELAVLHRAVGGQWDLMRKRQAAEELLFKRGINATPDSVWAELLEHYFPV